MPVRREERLVKKQKTGRKTSRLYLNGKVDWSDKKKNSHKGTKAQRFYFFEIKNHPIKLSKMYFQLSEKEKALAKEIVDAAYRVHKELGPGLLEKIYEACFCYELSKKGIRYKRQSDLPIIYDGQTFNEGLVIDVLVEDLIICELKAVEKVNSLWQAQMLSHLRLTKRRLGFLINFNVPLIKDGIKRFIV